MAKKDWETIKTLLGAKGDDLSVKQEEKFARAFESYLREGVAPKPELDTVFKKFKNWLGKIYQSADSLNVKVSPEGKKVFDRMLGADFSMEKKSGDKGQTPTGAAQLSEEEVFNQMGREKIEEDYLVVGNTPEKSTLWEDTKGLFSSTSDLAADAFVPISTRLGAIDQGLKHAVRRFIFNTQLYTHEDNKKVQPFIDKASNAMTEKDYRIFDLALKNRDTEKVDALIDAYGMTKEWAAVREVLDSIHKDANEAGLDVNYIEEYFPRKVQKNKVYEFLAAVKGKEYWSEIEQILLEADPNSTFTIEEQAQFINNYLRGFASARIVLSRPGFSKERIIDYVTPAWNQYYTDSMPTLIDYISAMRHGIEARKLFGKSNDKAEENIGEYVAALVLTEQIKQNQSEEVKKILKSVMEPTGTRGVVSWAKNASYIYLMGNPISAITQIQDLAFSMHHNGYWRTAVSFAKSVTGNQVLKKEDLGLENILQEFEDESRAAKAVRAVFKAVGLTFMDNIGKEVYIDASLSRLQKQAANSDIEFNKTMKKAFGVHWNEVKADLLAGKLTEDVKYLLFSELSDVQPISLAEMPVSYLNSGNGRIFYMLKTYTMRQIDLYRREIFSNLASGDMKKTKTGLRNLVSLGTALMLMGMGSDALKNLLLGRDIEIDDLIVDNLVKLFGVTKYQLYKSKVEGIATTFWKTLFIPPVFAPVDDAQKDINNLRKGNKSVKNLELWQRVPIVGKFYYWWFGGGSHKK